MSQNTPKTVFRSARPKAIIRLLDSTIIEIVLHSRLSISDALELIAKKCDLSGLDLRYFSLAIIDKSDNFHWLESSIILRDLLASSTSGTEHLSLSYHVRFFVDDILDVENPFTIKMYFLEVYCQLTRHELLVNSDDYFELLSLLLAIFPPENSEETIGAAINRIMPNSHSQYILIKHDEEDIEKEVFERYQIYQTLPIGIAMIRFLKTAQKSESYGYRMYEVWNELSEICLVSIGAKGIFVYRKTKNRSLITPYLAFPWRTIDNLYYRETKFSIEIRKSKKDDQKSAETTTDNILENDQQLSEAFNHPTTLVSSGRRRSKSIKLSNIYNFTCASSFVCRTIWSAAIAQHQFYLEQREVKKKSQQRNTLVDHQELVEKLNRLTSSSSLGSSLPSLSSLYSTSSAGTMPSAKIGDGSTSSLPLSTNAKGNLTQTQNSSTSSFHKRTPEEFKNDLRRYNELKERKTILKELLHKKLRELKDCCIEEGEITGILPDEIHMAVLPGDDFPHLKRRIGTAYSIPDEMIKADKGDKMSQLETDVELHRKIVAAASRLATEKHTNKSVRKKRQKDLQAARLRLNRLEQGLQQMRHSASKPDISSINSEGSNNSWSTTNNGANNAVTKSCPTTPRGSIPDLSRSHRINEDKNDMEDHGRVSRRAPSVISRHSLQQRYSGISSSSTSSGSDSIGMGLPPRPNSRKQNQLMQNNGFHYNDHLDNPMCDNSTNTICDNMGYRSTSYRSSYRQAHYPTIQDEQHQQQRKRAQSAHSISVENSGNNRSSTYSVPLNDACQQFVDVDYDGENEDVTPTIDHPSHTINVRRITSSISCQAGFATASLDRRYSGKTSGNGRINGINDDMIRQNITTRITTFPVAPPSTTVILAGKPYSASELPRFHAPPPVARVTHLPRGSLPPYTSATSQNNTFNGTNSSKFGMNTNPQMEALLSYYKQKQQSTPSPTRNQQPKTATIV